MSELRRYSDEEVREIIRRASEADAASAVGPGPGGAPQGMTLAQIQDIAGEVGLDPALVARAAAQMGGDGGVADRGRRVLGVPVSVGHVAELPARLTDREWDQMVVRFREVFSARGRVLHEGGLRGWANGNLQILEEPTASGYRLRMRSVSANAEASIVGGATAWTVGAGLLLLGLSQLGGIITPLQGLVVGGVLAGGGAALLWRGKVRASRWIATRKAQFRELGEWAALRLSAASDHGTSRLSRGDVPPTAGEMGA